MKHAILIFGMVLTAVFHVAGEDSSPSITVEADTQFIKALNQAEADYRKALGDVLKGADKIEIFLLDFESERAKSAEFDYTWYLDLPPAFFPIIPDHAQSHILARKTLAPGEVKRLLGPLQAVVGVEFNSHGAGCHYPIHGLRVWSKGQIVFQTSFCWHCANFYLQYPLSEAGWVGISGTALKDVMSQLMPIPQKEIDRFNAKYPSDDQKPTDQKPGK